VHGAIELINADRISGSCDRTYGVDSATTTDRYDPFTLPLALPFLMRVCKAISLHSMTVLRDSRRRSDRGNTAMAR